MDTFFIFAAVALIGAVVVARRWGSGGGESGNVASDGAGSGAGSGSYYGDYLNRADGTWHDCGMQYGGGADSAGHDSGGHDCDSGDGGADCGGDGGSD